MPSHAQAASGQSRSGGGSHAASHAQPASNRSHARGGSHKRKRGKGSTVLLVIGIILIVAALVDAGYLYMKYKKGDDFYAQVRSAQLTTEEPTGDLLDYSLNIDWAALQAENPDIVGWIQIPGTVIDYPIVQTTDNDFYLNHDFDKNPSSFGCIFLDCDSNPDLVSDYNSIIYGHHMRNGSMFKAITNYSDPEFLAAHPYIYIATPDGKTHCLKVFCYVVANGDEKLRQTSFGSTDGFQSYVQGALDRNEISTDVTADQVGHLYSFATCSYQFNDARTIVYAVEVDKFGIIVQPSWKTGTGTVSGGTSQTTAGDSAAQETVAVNG